LVVSTYACHTYVGVEDGAVLPLVALSCFQFNAVVITLFCTGFSEVISNAESTACIVSFHGTFTTACHSEFTCIAYVLLHSELTAFGAIVCTVLLHSFIIPLVVADATGCVISTSVIAVTCPRLFVVI
jgi:hypothetical protein